MLVRLPLVWITNWIPFQALTLISTSSVPLLVAPISAVVSNQGVVSNHGHQVQALGGEIFNGITRVRPANVTSVPPQPTPQPPIAVVAPYPQVPLPDDDPDIEELVSMFHCLHL